MGKDATTIRHTTSSDLEEVMAIYDYARVKMRDTGNPNQWIDGYPSVDAISQDIANENSYVIEKSGKIIGVFTFITGEDPTYNVIEGKWLNNKPYGTIHRIAAAPGAKGIADICLEFCRSEGIEIRIDTHSDNAPMLGWITSRGFTYCGIIYCHNGTPRLAFQKNGGIPFDEHA